MKILAHPDPVVLECELLARIDATHPRRDVARSLIVVPNARLARHVQRRLGTTRPGWLGLEVLHFRELAYRILERARREPPRVVSPRLLDAVLQRVLHDLASNPWAGFVERRPGALGRLRSALEDLRQAWIDPAETDRCARSRNDRALAEIYRGYRDALDRGAAAGWGDDAALAHAALPAAAAFGDGCRAIFLHGAYELVGIHLDLVRALDAAAGVTVLLPMRGGAPAFAFAERYSVEFLSGDREPVEPPDDAGDTVRPDLAALYAEASRPDPPPRGRFAFLHAQGEAAEVRVAVREALESVRRGCAPEEIVLTARALEPYGSALEEAFSDAGLPWSSTLAAPLRRYPSVRDFLLLLEIVATDFPRRATAELLRSPRIYWRSIGPGALPDVLDLADPWSREARILGGLSEWTEDLERWAGEVDERKASKARAIGDTLRALREQVEPAARSFGDHAERLRLLLRSLFFRDGDEATSAAVEALRGLIDEMAALEEVVGDIGRIEFDRMRRWLEEAVRSTNLPLHRRDEGGIRVCDVMQLRGITCRQLHLLGVNSGLLPRPPREDPILGDVFRKELRESSGRPLPVKADAGDEERLLLALTLGAATDGVRVSWQRADESGRAKTPSLALREIARIAVGRPDPAALEAVHLPSHPTQALEHLLRLPGLLAPGEEMLLTALRGRGRESVEALGERHPELAAGVRMLIATQPFRIVDPGYDGRIESGPGAKHLSVSALENLGGCPLRFFFGHVLRVSELREPAGATEIDHWELGQIVHDFLERLYGRLRSDGLFTDDASEERLHRALELFEDERGRILGEVGERMTRRLPVLGEQLAAGWATAVESFLRVDLVRSLEGFDTIELEESRTGTVAFGEGVDVVVRGRFDRHWIGKERAVVSDYKTSGDLSRRVHVTSMLKGQTLQVPLYAALAGPGTSVELLGVGPAYEYEGDHENSRHVFEGFGGEEVERGFRETMQVLLSLYAKGCFPLHKTDRCSWCPYDQACRRNHPPTTDREEISRDSAHYRGLSKKSTKRPLLPTGEEAS